MSNLLDLLIKNGLIVDGTDKSAFYGDIGILGDRIVSIQNEIEETSRHTIDAEGLVVSPGFIDVHSHNDLVPFMEDNIQELKLLQGVTTELVGQCGLGVVPCVDKVEELWKQYVKGVVGDPGIEWNFESMKYYMELIGQKGLKNNFAVLVSHGAIRARVMGFEKSEPAIEQMNMMKTILVEALEAGALGMSLGLQYMPGIFSSHNELKVLCEVVKNYNGIVMVHLRNHDNTILSAMNEIMAVAYETKVRLHISHMRSYNSTSKGCKAELLIDLIEDGINKGIDITFDEHLYLSGSTLMTQLLPPWVTGDNKDALFYNLKDKAALEKLKKELVSTETQYLGWDNYSLITGWDGILITSTSQKENIELIGRTVLEASTMLGMEPIDFVAKLLIEERSGVGIVTMNVFSEEDTIKLIKHPLQMVGSDSIPAGVPHPRLYGNYPLFLGKFVRELGVISLEKAIYKVSLLPAKTLGLKEVGQLAVGKKADITIFDFKEITGYEDYRNSTKNPKGIKYVLINGEIAVENGRVSNRNYGKVYKNK